MSVSSASVAPYSVSGANAGWSNPKIIAIFVLVLVCGLALGAALTYTFLHNRAAAPGRARVVGFTELNKELKLTPAQQEIIKRQLDDEAKYLQNIEEERISVADFCKRNIVAVLTPEQRKRFLELFGPPAPLARPSP